MKIKPFFLLCVLGIGVGVVWLIRNQTVLMEQALNRVTHEYFQNTIRLKSGEFDRRLKLNIQGMTGKLKTAEDPYPIEIRSLETQNSVAHLLFKKPVYFSFEGVNRSGSSWMGIKGTGQARADGFLRLEGNVEGIGLEDIAPLNSANLEGSKGEMRGRIVIETSPAREPVFEIDLHSQKPGGKIPSEIFAVFLPYLPQVQNKKELAKIILMGGLVMYDEADLKISSAVGGQIKLFLHMRLPDYNFILNLNVEIRVDEENLFQALSKWISAGGVTA